MTWTITKDDDGTLNIRAVIKPKELTVECELFVTALQRHLKESPAIPVASTEGESCFAGGNGAFVSGAK